MTIGFAAIVVTTGVTGAEPQVGPTFEVASIKPNTSGASLSGYDDKPGSLRVTNLPLRTVIAYAHRMHPIYDRGRIVGPGWLDTERFDITARVAVDVPLNRYPDLLKGLLVQRFMLAAHTEPREGPVYALVTARSEKTLGPQIRVSTVDCSKGGSLSMDNSRLTGGIETQTACGSENNKDGNGGIIRGGGRSMAELATGLTLLMNRVVIDRTGLPGAYDFVLRYTPDGVSPRADGVATPMTDGTSLVTALQEQLGLKLESQRGPVEYLIIDKVERPSPD
jgi:uncharacterized protein (TIGR03435 family)